MLVYPRGPNFINSMNNGREKIENGRSYKLEVSDLLNLEVWLNVIKLKSALLQKQQMLLTERDSSPDPGNLSFLNY